MDFNTSIANIFLEMSILVIFTTIWRPRHNLESFKNMFGNIRLRSYYLFGEQPLKNCVCELLQKRLSLCTRAPSEVQLKILCAKLRNFHNFVTNVQNLVRGQKRTFSKDNLIVEKNTFKFFIQDDPREMKNQETCEAQTPMYGKSSPSSIRTSSFVCLSRLL